MTPEMMMAMVIHSFTAQLATTPYGKALHASLTEEQREQLVKVVRQAAAGAAQSISTELDDEREAANIPTDEVH